MQLHDVVIVAIGVLGPPTSFQVNRLAKTFLNPPGTGPTDCFLSLPPTSIIPFQPVSSIDGSLPMSATVPAIRTGIPVMRSLSLGAQDAPAKPTLWQRLRSSSSSTSPWHPPQEGRSTDDYVPQSTADSIQGSLITTEPHWYPRMTAPRPVAPHSQYPNFTPGGQDLRWERSEDHPDWTWIGPLLWVYSPLDFISRINSLDRVTALLIPHGIEVDPESGEGILARHGSGRSRWASLTFEDLAVLAPWLDSHIKMKINGTDLGHD